MRKLGAILFLVVLAVAVWGGARWFAGRGQVKATILFRSAAGLSSGDPVMENKIAVGRVSRIDKVDDRDAVTVRLDKDHRRAIVSDSLFYIDDHKLVVTNTFAVGAPVENEAVLQAKEDTLSRWLAKNGSKVEPLVGKLKEKADEGVETVRTSSGEEAQKLKAKVDSWVDKVKKK